MIFFSARHDRHLMEKMFTEGAIRVMMCTATVLIQEYFLNKFKFYV